MKQQSRWKAFVWGAALVAALLLPAAMVQAQGAQTRLITDMAGRQVSIPLTVNKVLSTSPPPTTFIYMLAPEKLGAWLGSAQKSSTRYIPEQYRKLPSIAWGRGRTNYEAYIAAQPDLVLIGCEAASGQGQGQAELTQGKFGSIPVVCVDETRNATGYADTLVFMGDLLGVPERAAALVSYYQDVLSEVETKVAAIPAEQRVRVYYAEDSNGLKTDPRGSVHAQLIDVCGGVNVADCTVDSGSGMTAVTMESLLMWQPQVIITTSPEFVAQAPADASWQQVRAIRNGQVYLAPSQPQNWFDRPPGVNRIVGIPWTAHLLYPELFSRDWLETKVQKFYQLYYHYRLSSNDLQELLAP